MPAQTNKAKTYPFPMDQGSKRVLGIITGIPVARHLKATENLFDSRCRPHAEARSRQRRNA
jgi:hypothetical protein